MLCDAKSYYPAMVNKSVLGYFAQVSIADGVFRCHKGAGRGPHASFKTTLLYNVMENSAVHPRADHPCRREGSHETQPRMSFVHSAQTRLFSVKVCMTSTHDEFLIQIIFPMRFDFLHVPYSNLVMDQIQSVLIIDQPRVISELRRLLDRNLSKQSGSNHAYVLLGLVTIFSVDMA